MNFTYKNPNVYDKKYAILKQLEVAERIKKSNEKAILYSLSKKEYIKIQDVETNMIESKIVNNNNNILTNNAGLTIDIDTNIAKKFEMVENIKNDESYNDEDSLISDHEKELYNIKNINNSISIQVQDVETTMIETLPVPGPKNEKDLYDIKNVNENINSKLTIDFVDSTNVKNESMYENEIIVPYNVERIRNKGVKIIHNVYQSKYSKGEINGTGLGDFIRGSYFLLEFCEKYNFEPRILFNNCISKFLLPVNYDFNLKLINPLLANIDMFHNNNFKEYKITEDQIILEPKLDVINIMADFVEYIMKEPVYNGNTFIYCIPYPLKNISEKSKAYMQSILEPVDEIKIIVQKSLHQVGLHFKNYIVFHIRSGDDYLNKDNKIFYQKYLDKIKIEIEIYMAINGSNNYLVIADNNEIKILLNKEFPQLKIILKEITHFGEGVALEEDKVKNTLIDFYLLSFANKIISFSAYKHGSGFSFWCAKTFDVPYISKYISS
jgi:hypothetical protein